MHSWASFMASLVCVTFLSFWTLCSRLYQSPSEVGEVGVYNFILGISPGPFNYPNNFPLGSKPASRCLVLFFLPFLFFSRSLTDEKNPVTYGKDPKGDDEILRYRKEKNEWGFSFSFNTYLFFSTAYTPNYQLLLCVKLPLSPYSIFLESRA